MHISSSVCFKESCLKLRYVYLSSSVRLNKSCFKVAVCIYHQLFITRKVVESCGMYLSWSGHLKESCLKLWYANIIECSSKGKLF